MSKQCEITKIVVQIGKKDHTLTIEEAKRLHAALGDLFGNKMVVKHEHHHHERPRYYWGWSQPCYVHTLGNQGDIPMQYTIDYFGDNTAMLSLGN